MQYAFFGEAKSESLDRFAQSARQGARAGGLQFRRRRPAGGEPRAQPRGAGRGEAVPARRARHVRARGLRASRASGADRGVAARRLPDAAARAGEPRPRLRARRGRVVHDHGARPLRRLRGLGGGAREERHRAARAARQLAPDHRQRVQDRPRARALGGRRDHRVDPRRRRPARRAQPPAEPVPHRGSAHRARAATREAALRHRRAVRTATSRLARTPTASG